MTLDRVGTTPMESARRLLYILKQDNQLSSTENAGHQSRHGFKCQHQSSAGESKLDVGMVQRAEDHEQ
eukprot:1161288-Pelagomonas_calceolata.AAC.7